MKILILPPSDYLGHPNPCRLHHIFEQFPGFGDEIYIMRFSIQDKIVRKSNGTVFSIGDVPSTSLAKYYLINSGVFAKSASEIISQFGIDVILFANLFPPYLVSKAISKDLLSIVDLVDHYPTVAAENVPGFIPKSLVNYTFSRMMKSIIGNSDSTVACSYKLADYARYMGSKDVYRIPNGVEEYFFLDYQKDAAQIRQKLGINNSDLSICFVGNVEYWLSMGDFLDALYMVKKKTSRKIRFYIVGGKLTTNYVGQIENKVRELNLGENVIQVGFVPHSDVPKYIAAADLCVSPKNPLDPVSYYSSPVKVWEYLAQEKPVISTPVPEILRSASDCVSIANTSEEYFNHIMAFLENPSMFREKAKKGKTMIQQYTWQKVAKSYRNLLQQLLSQKKANNPIIQ
jgi:glycosyltransferase involved in cell wall biosynthesis